MKLTGKTSMVAARLIVATLIHRKRLARRLVRQAETVGAPNDVLVGLRAAAAEAHNAAETARRILYHGIDAI